MLYIVFCLALLFFMEVDYKNNVVPIAVDGLKNDYLKTFSSRSSSPSNSIVDVLYLHSLINDVIYLKSISLEFPARQNSSVFKIEHWVLTRISQYIIFWQIYLIQPSYKTYPISIKSHFLLLQLFWRKRTSVVKRRLWMWNIIGISLRP